MTFPNQNILRYQYRFVKYSQLVLPFKERNKLKRYICIVFTDFRHTKLYPFQNLSLEFILKVFLRFRKFQPGYSYKIYSYRKKRVYIKKPLKILILNKDAVAEQNFLGNLLSQLGKERQTSQREGENQRKNDRTDQKLSQLQQCFNEKINIDSSPVVFARNARREQGVMGREKRARRRRRRR